MHKKLHQHKYYGMSATGKHEIGIIKEAKMEPANTGI